MSIEPAAWRPAAALAGRGEAAVRLADGRYLARRVVVARSVFSRFMGLMGRAEPEPDEGLWLVPCRSIHMFFMRTAIDVAFLDRQGVVVRAVSRMRPWSLRPIGVTLLPVARAHSALELAPGTLERLGVGVGAQFDFSERPQGTGGQALSRAASGNSDSTTGE
ncbi:MAG: DUF192 domain-containing protein, partial [Candidatus Dormibacteria bacterium]